MLELRYQEQEAHPSLPRPEEGLDYESCLTTQEIALLQQITGRKIKYYTQPTCDGAKRLVDLPNARNSYKPKSWGEINPLVRQGIINLLLKEWKKAFIQRGRKRPAQIAITVPFPTGSRFEVRLITNISKEEIRIISPFKHVIQTNSILPSDSIQT